MIKRVLLALFLAVAFGLAWRSMIRIPIEVIGQPTSTGFIQSELEAPFFHNLARNTGLPLDVQYRALDTVGFKDSHQLAMLKEGAFDLVSLRFLQNSAAEPTFVGLDLVGLNSDFETGHASVQAYEAILAARLKQRFNVKLLGVWPFGPQVFFCRKPIARLADMAGLRVRVGGQNLAPLVSAAGGLPVIVPFDDVKDALKNDMIDCAVTSSASANAAGWPEHATHFFPLALQLGLNGYAISMRAWDALSTSQQQVLEDAFKNHVEAVWRQAKILHDDTSSCNVGGPCRAGTPYHLTRVEPTEADRQILRTVRQGSAFQAWAAACDKVHPGCSADWLSRLRPILQEKSS